MSLVEMRNIVKEFPSVRALDGVSHAQYWRTPAIAA